MAAVTVRNGALWVDEMRVPLFAGECHYWRVNPARWGAILDSMRQLGLNVVATYVAWEYHEVEPGRFDFTGQTEPPRNLVGFLDLLQQRDFWIFIRPGPYIYAEWTHAGVPRRVVTLPRLGAEYRRAARVWMQAVTEVLRPYFATNGGRIVLFQPDNEMDLFSHWFERDCGLDGSAPGFFQQFTREAYGDVATLNAAWGTDFASLDDATPHATRLNQHDPGGLTRHKDYWRFQHWATATAVRWHVDTYRELGVDLPQVANYYPGGDVQNWREVARQVDLCGIDWYPRQSFGHNPSEHQRFLDTCRYQRAFSPLAFIAEFECGVWHGFHDYVGALGPQHYRLLACSALLAGIQGFNWYMFVGRDNWLYSPVNERGEARPDLADVFHGIHRVVAEIDPPALEKLTPCCVLLEPVHIGTDRILHDNPVLSAMYASDVDFEVFDPEIGAVEKPLMIYAAAEWLSRESQQRLVAYMEAGGTLVLFQRYPQRDERFQPHNGLDVRPPDRVLSPLGKKLALDLGARQAVVEGPVWCWDAPPGEPLVGTQTAGQQQAVENADEWMKQYVGKQWTCGYREPRGAGALVVIGLPPNAALVRAVHQWCGFPIAVQADLPGVQTALFTRAGAYYLVATSLQRTDLQTRVVLDGVDLPPRVHLHDLWTDAAWEADRDALYISLPAAAGGVWRITGARRA